MWPQVDSIEADNAAAITESWSQAGTALEARETFKMGDKLALHYQLLVSSIVSVEAIAERFKKLSLLCHPDHGGSHNVFVRLQRAH